MKKFLHSIIYTRTAHDYSLIMDSTMNIDDKENDDVPETSEPFCSVLYLSVLSTLIYRFVFSLLSNRDKHHHSTRFLLAREDLLVQNHDWARNLVFCECSDVEIR